MLDKVTGQRIAGVVVMELWQLMHPAAHSRWRRMTLAARFRLWRRRRKVDDLAGVRT